MNKEELVQEISKKAKVTQKEANEVLSALIETVEKAAEILVKVISMGGKKVRPTAQEIIDVCEEYNLDINKALL